MTVIQIIDAFAFYGADTMLLAALNCALVQLVKATILKRCQKKAVTFLPFIFGCILYAAYAALRNMSAAYVLENYVSVLEHGLSVGALSTVTYVCYEQFIRRKESVSVSVGVIKTLIEGYVPSENLEKAAAEIAKSIERDVTGDGARKAAEIILSYADGETSESDVKLLARLIIETLAHVDTVRTE